MFELDAAAAAATNHAVLCYIFSYVGQWNILHMLTDHK